MVDLFNLIYDSGVACDYVHELYVDDPLDAMATNFDLSTVRQRDVDAARDKCRKMSQELLRRTHADPLTVHRGLTGAEGKQRTVSVTLDPHAAAFHSKWKGRSGPVARYQLSIGDVLGYSEALGRGTFAEAEIVCFADALRPAAGGKGRRAAGGAASGAQILYHATFAKNVPKIRRRGLLPMQPSLWVKASDRSRYGRGEIFAFESATDAVRWAAKMDWELNRNMGTGDVVVVAFDGGDRRWAVDESDPLSQAGGEGRWLKSDAAVPAAAIVAVHPVTLALVRQVTAGRVRLEGGGKARRAPARDVGALAAAVRRLTR